MPYLTVLLLFPIVYYITHTFPTYRYPIEPTMLILASYATVFLGKACREGYFVGARSVFPAATVGGADGAE